MTGRLGRGPRRGSAAGLAAGLAALALALVLALVSACSSAGGGGNGSVDPVRFHRYVALGDSYTAAPFVPASQLDNGCLRSSGNYPSLVARALPGTPLVDVSCSGADTGSMTHVQRIGGARIPPQLHAVTRRTDLVTLGIGGNDFGLFGTLVGTCTRLRSSDPTGAPCRDQNTAGGVDRLAGRLHALSRRVAGVVAAIRERAPHAEVVVVGYPQIIPAHGACPRLLPLAAGDYPYARRVNQRLDAAVRLGARRADAFVDVFAHSRGHDICAAHPWINGQVTDVNRALAYHPFAAEQAAVARLVLATLRR